MKYFFLVKIHSSIYFLQWTVCDLSKYILDYRKKQTGTLWTSENITFENDGVMNYVIGGHQQKLPQAPLPFNPALAVLTVSFHVGGLCLTGLIANMALLPATQFVLGWRDQGVFVSSGERTEKRYNKIFNQTHSLRVLHKFHICIFLPVLNSSIQRLKFAKPKHSLHMCSGIKALKHKGVVLQTHECLHFRTVPQEHWLINKDWPRRTRNYNEENQTCRLHSTPSV